MRPGRQLAGATCVACGERVVMATTGVACGECGVVLHTKVCADRHAATAHAGPTAAYR